MSDKKLDVLIDSVSPKRKHEFTLLGMLVVVALCIGAAVAYFLLRPKLSKSSEKSMKKNARIFGAYWPIGQPGPSPIKMHAHLLGKRCAMGSFQQHITTWTYHKLVCT